MADYSWFISKSLMEVGLGILLTKDRGMKATKKQMWLNELSDGKFAGTIHHSDEILNSNAGPVVFSSLQVSRSKPVNADLVMSWPNTN